VTSDNLDERLNKRAESAARIRAAYDDAIKAVAHVGKLLRTTEAGRYLWADRHKTSVSGVKAMLGVLRDDVPRYGESSVMRQILTPPPQPESEKGGE